MYSHLDGGSLSYLFSRSQLSLVTMQTIMASSPQVTWSPHLDTLQVPRELSQQTLCWYQRAFDISNKTWDLCKGIWDSEQGY